jgi:hypothetical protein
MINFETACPTCNAMKGRQSQNHCLCVLKRRYSGFLVFIQVKQTRIIMILQNTRALDRDEFIVS